MPSSFANSPLRNCSFRRSMGCPCKRLIRLESARIQTLFTHMCFLARTCICHASPHLCFIIRLWRSVLKSDSHPTPPLVLSDVSCKRPQVSIMKSHSRLLFTRSSERARPPIVYIRVIFWRGFTFILALREFPIGHYVLRPHSY